MELIVIYACLLGAVVCNCSSINLPKAVSYALKPTFDGRIVNGEAASRGQFPYQVGVKTYDSITSFWCGGSLISNKFILTAGHCTEGAVACDVYLGALNRTSRKEEGRVIIQIGQENIFAHEEYDTRTLSNDIALLKLPKEIEFGLFVQPISLPKPDDYFLLDVALTSGWGRTSDDTFGATDVLQYVETEIMENFKCAWYFYGGVSPRNICIDTSRTRKSPCRSDSGGPLVVFRDGEPYLVGINSFGAKRGCEVGAPSVFTRVSTYLKWIEKKSDVKIHAEPAMYIEFQKHCL